MSGKSFAVLEAQTEVTSAELVEHLQNYVDTRAAISAPVVIGLINRVALTDGDRVNMIFLTAKGANGQRARGFGRDADEYLKVAEALAG